MRDYSISKRQAISLRIWALRESGAKPLLGTLPRLPKKGEIRPGLYVDYSIDEDELDGGIDWPDVGVVALYALLEENSEKIYLGEIRAYNWETYWLSTSTYDEVATAAEWFNFIKEDYEKARKAMEDL